MGGEGSFECTCRAGYAGNGVNCTSETAIIVIAQTLFLTAISFSAFLQTLMSVPLQTTVQMRQCVVTLMAAITVHVIQATLEMEQHVVVCHFVI